jgi:hypothetical protein
MLVAEFLILFFIVLFSIIIFIYRKYVASITSIGKIKEEKKVMKGLSGEIFEIMLKKESLASIQSQR